ncbi:Peroxidase 47 precursor, putative [Ricinus communis]|uniref:peroxidase n=1 Tax=Ricinus communis TaxID=3988 RepID=B9RPS8_RICCO|nr:Peroxidase 47 precursor, putative [Ricinus communis]
MRGNIGYLGLIIFGLLAFISSTEAQLQMNFYAKSCPKAEKIVSDFVNEHIHNAPSLTASFIRMHFHDCFVRGGPSWQVPTGIRDGVISRSSEATAIPAPFANITTLQTLFANQGLDLKDLVLLSGAHTIGMAHCSTISDRLSPDDTTTKIEMDPGSRKTFDLSYYSLLLKRRGLFESDAALTTNSVSLSFINQILKGSLQDFFAEYANSMEKMGRINVKTGSDGEIRKHCAVVN